jgi:hypothetical protein
MQPLRSILVLIILIQNVIIVQLFSASKSNSPIAGNKYGNVVPNVIVIKFSEDYQITENSINTKNFSLNDRLRNSDFYALKSVFKQNITGLKKSLSSDLSKIYLAFFQGEKTPREMAELASSWPGVVYAEPKYLHYLLEEEFPNDTLYSTQSGYYEVIDAPQAWGIVKAEQGEAIIAIVDGGTDIDHVDLSDNIWQNQAEVDGITGVDDDENGFVDDLYGWNFANQSGDPTGLTGTPFNADHGTHTAGIACAVTDNITGVAGTSWNATVMGINASDEVSDKYIKYGFEGIIYAAKNGADIISCSWGSQLGFSYFEQDVVNHAASLGAIVIAAAGNKNSNISFYPAAYANVLSIAGTTVNDERYWDSNYGLDIDLAAPAVSIFSTFNNDTYGFATGTSMSAPMVAGAAGLVRIQHPDWTGLQLGEQVRVTADSLPAVTVPLGRGRLNAYRAVTEISPSIRLADYRSEDENRNGIIEPGERVEIFITIQNYLEQATDVNLILTSADPYVTISQSDIYVASISTMDTIPLVTPFVCEIAEDAPEAYTIEFLLKIITNEYNDVDNLSLTVLPGYINLTINNIKMTVTSLGRIVNSVLEESQDSVGFSYNNMGNLLAEGAIISGTSESQISNAARAESGVYDEDFVVTPDGEITAQIPGELSDEESFGQFIDLEAVNPMNIRISQYTYAWQDSVNDDYIIMLFGIQNLKPDDLNNFHFGLYFDWDIDDESYDTNVIQYDSERNMGFAYDVGDGPETYVGVVNLNDEEMNFTPIYWEDVEVFTDAEKWQSISSGISNEKLGPADVTFVIANGPLSISAHSIHRLAFAMVAADDSAGLFEHADSAIAMWDKLIILNVEKQDLNHLPISYGLSQNYPNPFNPRTIINYELPITNWVELNIYNLLGQKVATLVSEEQKAGYHQVEWKASGFSSGVYFYHLRAGDFRDVKKMVIMK